MRITTPLIVCSLTITQAVGAPIFLFLKNLPAQPGSLLDSSGPSRSYSPDGSNNRLTSSSMKERAIFADKVGVSDGAVPKLGNTVAPPPHHHHTLTSEQLILDDLQVVSRLGGHSEADAELTTDEQQQLKVPATIVELEMGGLTRHFYMPCHSHKNTLHYYHVRKYADLMVFGVIASFMLALLLLETWGPICERVRRYRSREGAIRLEDTKAEKAMPNRERPGCMSCRTYNLGPDLEARQTPDHIADEKPREL